MRRDVFQAIADPTRREIISLIAKGFYQLSIGVYSQLYPSGGETV